MASRYARPPTAPYQRHRRSIRLQDCDYTQPGMYFITVCARDRQCLFGDVVDDKMRLNNLGQIVQTTWMDLPKHYAGLALDAFVIMPNHVHGIITINAVDDGAPVGAIHELPPFNSASRAIRESPLPHNVSERRCMLLSKIVGRWKMTTAKHINALRGTPSAGLWQRNYYEHIIRNADSLERVRNYITDNPRHWATDPENPF